MKEICITYKYLVIIMWIEENRKPEIPCSIMEGIPGSVEIY
jgi:hypothetical protein